MTPTLPAFWQWMGRAVIDWEKQEEYYLDALLNRASLLYEQGDYASARRDVEHGLQIDPGNAHLLCTLGVVEIAQRRPEEAYQALSSAIECDPSLGAAWTNRAILAFESEQVDGAIDDLTHAIALGENATALYNRGIAYQSQERWSEAIQELQQLALLQSRKCGFLTSFQRSAIIC